MDLKPILYYRLFDSCCALFWFNKHGKGKPYLSKYAIAAKSKKIQVIASIRRNAPQQSSADIFNKLKSKKRVGSNKPLTDGKLE
jgi:hypothetical protein